MALNALLGVAIQVSGYGVPVVRLFVLFDRDRKPLFGLIRQRCTGN